MKNQVTNPKRRSKRQTPSRIEQLAVSIEDHLAALDEKTYELHAETIKAENRGYTPQEGETLDLTYVTAPLLMLLITARTIIDGLPEDSGFDREQIIRIVERNEQQQAPAHEMGEDLVDLIRNTLDYIKNNESQARGEGRDLPTIH